MRKFQSFFTVGTIPTPKGTLTLFEHYPARRTDPKWREYVLYYGTYIAGEAFLSASKEEFLAWVSKQSAMTQQPLL